MSRIRRISIRGVRNFGDEKDEIIRFTRPLTLIIGQNGVGKTTVIECLRYASTGEFPPGSDRGKGFIHDPVLKKGQSVQVRGLVKAEMIDKDGIILTVSRSIEAVRQSSSTKFRTVDNTLSKENKETGEKYDLTHRCVDVDKEIKASLGISTAILNNVIFCHQDDSNWPLDESRKLKERFDEIFDTTRYNKALELVRKLIKQKTADVRVIVAAKIGLQAIVREVEAKECKYNDFVERKKETTEKIQNLLSEIQPIKEKIDGLKAIEVQVQELRLQEQRKDVELVHTKQLVKDLSSSIKTLFEGSDEALQELIKSYDKRFVQINDKIDEINRKVQQRMKTETKICATLAEDRIRVGTLQQQMNDHEKQIVSRNQLLGEMMKMLKMQALDSNATESEVQDHIQMIEKKLEQLEQLLKTMQVDHVKNEGTLNKKIESLRDRRTKLTVEMNQNDQEINKTRETLRDTRTQILLADDAAKKLNSVESKLESVDRQIEQITKTIKMEDLSNSIEQETILMENLEEECTQVEDLLGKMQMQSSLCGKLETLKLEADVKCKEIEQLERKNSEKLEEILGREKIKDKQYLFNNTVEEIKNTLTKRLQNLHSEIKIQQGKATALETTIDYEKKELNKKISQIKSDKEKVAIHCPDYMKYHEKLVQLEQKLKRFETLKGMYTFETNAYGEYIKTLSKTNPCCPLCERGFPNQSDATKLVGKMNNHLKSHPERLKQCQTELNNNREVYNTLLSLKTTVESIVKFENSEKSLMIQSIAGKEQELKRLRSHIEELEQSIVEPERKIILCNSMSGDLLMLRRYVEDSGRIQATYSDTEDKIEQSGLSTDKTIKQVQNERETLKQKIKAKRDAISSLRTAMDLQKEELKRVTEIRAKCLEERMAILNEVQKVKQLKENEGNLIKKEAELKTQAQALRQKLYDAQDELDTAVRHGEELKKKNRDEEESEREKIARFTKLYDKLNTIQMCIIEFKARKIDSRLHKLETEIKEHEEHLAATKAEKSALENELREMKETVAGQEMKKRNLSDNFELRHQKSVLETIQNEIKNLQREIRGFNTAKIAEQIQVHEKKKQETEREVNIALGTQEELNLNIKQLKAELRSDTYRTARDDYRKKWVEKMLTEDAIADLQVYVKALDLSMTNYHEERMNSVNKSMKNLWKLIYTGTDTSSIQIRTEAATGTGTRRQFNYKLVQVKHGVEMDMKGRCSAGQRVLASIVIRLALAETFCDQCGMLALDEPTTNLDAGNAANLAEALFNYVSLRASYQKNFQLIVITHDEHFIQLLSELNNSKGFYELYRNNDGLTKVRYLEKINVSQKRLKSIAGKRDDKNKEEDLASQENNPGKKRPHSPNLPNRNGNKKTKTPFNFAL